MVDLDYKIGFGLMDEMAATILKSATTQLLNGKPRDAVMEQMQRRIRSAAERVYCINYPTARRVDKENLEDYKKYQADKYLEKFILGEV